MDYRHVHMSLPLKHPRSELQLGRNIYLLCPRDCICVTVKFESDTSNHKCAGMLTREGIRAGSKGIVRAKESHVPVRPSA